MGGVAQPPEHHVRCLPPLTLRGGDEKLRIEIDGKPKGVTLRIEKLSRNLVARMPDRSLDLIEIAALSMRRTQLSAGAARWINTWVPNGIAGSG